jgi:hypothetical protein
VPLVVLLQPEGKIWTLSAVAVHSRTKTCPPAARVSIKRQNCNHTDGDVSGGNS